jgi:membrane protease YdiL (CAAX protease family)
MKNSSAPFFHPVPWGGFDLLVVLLFYVVVQSGIIGLERTVLGPGALQHSVARTSDEDDAAHPLTKLVAEGNVWILLLCFVSAVVAAPVAEEFAFRVLLQGWFQALERRWRRKMPTLRRMLPRAAGPILLASLLFGAMHFRVAGPPLDERSLLAMMVGNVAGNLLTLGLAMGFLRWRVGATAADFGWAPQRLPRDVGLGLVAFAAIVVPIFAIQFALVALLAALKIPVAPDPITLFLLAIVLGTLYFRTHRIMPSIVVHAALNATSLAFALLGG